MLKKLLMLFLAFSLSIGAAFAATDVNTADEASLEAIKGLGPVKSKAIIAERTANGPFKDADDLANRVKGLGTKSVGHLEEAGLTVGGSSAPPTGAKPATTKTPATSTSAAPGKSTVKSSAAATAATSPAATTATTPAVTPDAASAPKAKKSKKAKAADTASGPATATADAASGASGAKASKKSKKKKAASDAAAT